MSKKPPGLSIEVDIDQNINELSKNPVVTKNGTVYLGNVIISTAGVTSDGRGTVTLNPEELEPVSPDVVKRGSSGMVRKMRNKFTGQMLALKEIKVSSEQRLSEISRELEILHQGGDVSQHPNLIDFYGAYSLEGSVYIAMECMDGSLAEMDKRAVPEPVLAKMTKMMLSGLNYLHKQRHLIHRDIKPSNLLFNNVGTIKITDFGVSSTLDTTQAESMSFVGTVTYMSPERLKGTGHGTAADIWALGISLVELALGTHPFLPLLGAAAGQPTEAKFWPLLQHLNSSAKTVELPESFSDEFRDFIDKCCTKDPAIRPSSQDLLQHTWILENTDADNVRNDEKGVIAWITGIKPKKKDPRIAPQKKKESLDALLSGMCDINRP